MLGSFESRTLVNGSMLRQFTGQIISIIVYVEDEMGNKLIASTPDKLKVSVTLPLSVEASPGDWIEVIGKPLDGNTIRGQEAILFGGENIDFDKDGYNQMIHYINNCKEIYRCGQSDSSPLYI